MNKRYNLLIIALCVCYIPSALAMGRGQANALANAAQQRRQLQLERQELNRHFQAAINRKDAPWIRNNEAAIKKHNLRDIEALRAMVAKWPAPAPAVATAPAAQPPAPASQNAWRDNQQAKLRAIWAKVQAAAFSLASIREINANILAFKDQAINKDVVREKALRKWMRRAIEQVAPQYAEDSPERHELFDIHHKWFQQQVPAPAAPQAVEPDGAGPPDKPAAPAIPEPAQLPDEEIARRRGIHEDTLLTLKDHHQNVGAVLALLINVYQGLLQINEHDTPENPALQQLQQINAEHGDHALDVGIDAIDGLARNRELYAVLPQEIDVVRTFAHLGVWNPALGAPENIDNDQALALIPGMLEQRNYRAVSYLYRKIQAIDGIQEQVRIFFEENGEGYRRNGQQEYFEELVDCARRLNIAPQAAADPAAEEARVVAARTDYNADMAERMARGEPAQEHIAAAGAHAAVPADEIDNDAALAAALAEEDGAGRHEEEVAAPAREDELLRNRAEAREQWEALCATNVPANIDLIGRDLHNQGFITQDELERATAAATLVQDEAEAAVREAAEADRRRAAEEERLQREREVADADDAAAHPDGAHAGGDDADAAPEEDPAHIAEAGAPEGADAADRPVSWLRRIGQHFGFIARMKTAITRRTTAIAVTARAAIATAFRWIMRRPAVVAEEGALVQAPDAAPADAADNAPSIAQRARALFGRLRFWRQR